MAKVEDKRGVRITGQFRQQQAMLYDLKCDGVRITISIAPEAKPSEDWNAAALAALVPAPPRISAVGRSKGEAVDALGSACCDPLTAGGFPFLDWKAIREALAALRAI
jgi:hypothetical protein